MSVAIICVLLILALGWGWHSSNLILKLPRTPLSILPSSFGTVFERISFMTEDGLKIQGWFIPSKTQSSDKTIIVCHGWGANKSDVLTSTIFLNLNGGFNLLYFDFRNHGESEGEITTMGVLEMKDVKSALEFLRVTKPEASRWIGIHGFSMGGAVAILSAAHFSEIRAVVAQSPPASFDRVVKRYARLYYRLPTFPAVNLGLLFVRARVGLNLNRYSADLFVQKISPRPLFLIQGLEDRRMPSEVGRRLFALAGEPKTIWEVPEAHHGEIYVLVQKEYEEKVLKFFKKASEKRTD